MKYSLDSLLFCPIQHLDHWEITGNNRHRIPQGKAKSLPMFYHTVFLKIFLSTWTPGSVLVLTQKCGCSPTRWNAYCYVHIFYYIFGRTDGYFLSIAGTTTPQRMCVYAHEAWCSDYLRDYYYELTACYSLASWKQSSASHPP